MVLMMARPGASPVEGWFDAEVSKLCGKIWIPCFEALHGPSHTWELWYADPLRINGHSGGTGPKIPVANIDKVCI